MTIQSFHALAITACLSASLYADNTNPYTNGIPGFDPQAMQKTIADINRKKKERDARRKAIGDRIAKEELARAKANARPGTMDDPYAVANVETRKRMQPYYDKWAKEDAAEKAQQGQPARQSFQKYQQTGDLKSFAEQQTEMLKSMGIDFIKPQK